jgi:hypothetical protein
MSRIVLTGIDGANPLGFLASVGLLRTASQQFERARLGFLDDGSYRPFVENVDAALEEIVATDAAAAAGPQPWRLSYAKAEKRGQKTVEDLKAPPEAFRAFLLASIDLWLKGDCEAVAYGAAFGTSNAVDGNGNTKPTAFHFTAANQQFLGAIEAIRAQVDVHWARKSLFEGNASRSGGNVRWDPAADRNYALMADNPNAEGTSVDAPLEWLAFRALPLFPTIPEKTRVRTTAVSGWSDEMAFTWPLWSAPATWRTVMSLIRLRPEGQSTRGVFAVARSTIRRTSQGFGNFGPASVSN